MKTRLIWIGILQAILLWVCWAQQPASGEELAPGALGTRSDTPMPITAPNTSGSSWVQVSLALLIVGIGLRYGLPKLLRWAGKSGEGSLLDGQVRVIETRAVPNGSLLLVRAREKLLLIGSSPQGMQVLADLTPPADPIAPVPETAFDQLLKGARPYQPPIDPQQAVAEQVQSRLQQTRERLTRLNADGRL